jgi:hypothetical protein
MVRLKRNYTDTSQFDNDILPWGKALATSLQWLYDDDEFEDDSLSEAEYDRNMLYYMDGVLPICDFMSVVTDVIYLAFQDFGGPNIKNYINLLQDFETRKWGDKPHLQYDGECMILGKVSIFTTEVILWAAYLYCHIRKDFEPENERVVRADKLLYKLYARQTCLKPELVKDTFLMKHFNKTAVAFLKHIPTQGKDSKEGGTHSDPKSVNMEESVIDKISANNIRYYYEGWRNGKHGSICQQNGIYRFVEQARGKSGMVDDVNRNEEDNPIVAKGIVAYWLQFNSRIDTVIKRLTKYNCEIPKDIREQFDNYTQIRFEQFKREYRDDPNTWDWDWEKEFYANVIIPHEMAFNKMSEALFDYISDSDIVLVRGVMNSYIKYLKKIRTEKGYQVNPELLVLRAVNSKDETKYEDLEDYEVKAILEKLKGEGYIDAMWVHGQERPWTIKLLDKGRYYLKQLEEGIGVVESMPLVETAPVVTPQQPPMDNTSEIPPQTQNISVREVTWAERKQCFKTAVLVVMEKKKADGNYLFQKNAQWKAVYRFAIDKSIMYELDDSKEPKDSSTPQYALFEDFAHELHLDENPPTRLPFTKNAIDNISKDNFVRYNAPYPWSYEGITDPRSLELYVNMDDVYSALVEEYDNCIRQAEKSTD